MISCARSISSTSCIFAQVFTSASKVFILLVLFNSLITLDPYYLYGCAYLYYAIALREGSAETLGHRASRVICTLYIATWPKYHSSALDMSSHFNFEVSAVFSSFILAAVMQHLYVGLDAIWTEHCLTLFELELGMIDLWRHMILSLHTNCGRVCLTSSLSFAC